MSAESHGYPKLRMLTDRLLSEGRNIFVADRDHTALAVIYHALGNPGMLATMNAHGATLVLEGDYSKTQVVEDYRHGRIDATQLAAEMVLPYHAHDAEKREDMHLSQSSLLQGAIGQSIPILYPEQGTAYDALKADPEMAAMLHRISNGATSTECFTAQFPHLMGNLSDAEQKAMERLTTLIDARDTTAENARITDKILEHEGPYVVAYGASHMVTMAPALNAATVGIMATRRMQFTSNEEHLPEYIYIADTDTVHHIPKGSFSRAKFAAENAAIENGQTPLEVFAREARAAACVAALPAEARKQPLSLAFLDVDTIIDVPLAPVANGKPADEQQR